MLSLKVDTSQVDKYAEKIWEYVQEQLTRIIKYKGITKTIKSKKSKLKLLPEEEIFLKSINNEKGIKNILTSDIPNLKLLIDDFEKKHPILRNKKNSFNRILYNIFVSNIYENKDRFDGLKFVNDIGLQTCPYCNRAYIQTVNKRGIVRPQIDHFYPKSLYPYLGLSFYNLIPSCSVCNGTTAKGEKDSYKDNLISPYEIKNDDFKFNFDFKTSTDFEIKFDKKIDINDKYFKLEEFYKHHSDIAYELYVKVKQENTKEYFDSLEKSLKGIGFNMDEVYRFITCAYLKNEDLHKRPLSKLIKDISEELDLI